MVTRCERLGGGTRLSSTLGQNRPAQLDIMRADTAPVAEGCVADGQGVFRGPCQRRSKTARSWRYVFSIGPASTGQEAVSILRASGANGMMPIWSGDWGPGRQFFAGAG